MIKHPYFDELREKISFKNDAITEQRLRWIERNPYFYRQLLKSLKFIIEENSKVLHVHCSIGYILNELKPSYGVGIDSSAKQIERAKTLYPNLNFYSQEEGLSPPLNEKFDYILINSIEDIVDIKAVLDSVKNCCNRNTRIITLFSNYLWQPLVKLAEWTNLRFPQQSHNWISTDDLRSFLRLSGYEECSSKPFIIFPFNIPGISYFLNRFVARLPILWLFSMMRISVARMLADETKQHSLSIIIPCKNEAGNIESAIKRIPQMGLHTEIIFGDDKSTDGTLEIIKQMIAKYPEKDIKLIHGPGICKAENVWTCFDHAKGDILMILDADLTVVPEELPYFYEAIVKGQGEFINGSRLIYPMHKNAMPFFNTLGNKFFSMAFSYILDTKIKDTLCGTKVLWRSDYEKIKQLRGAWGINDRWGDYELIFGASKRHLKIIDLPVHYVERVYGETKMTKVIKNGFIMLRMCKAALFRIKFY